jgi:flagellar biosynthesis GTPase FlhF
MFSRLKNLAERGQASSPQSSDDKGESLTTILPTREDRANLLLLIADLIELMRVQLVDTFDPSKSESATPLKIGRSLDQLGDDAALEIKPAAAEPSVPGLEQATEDISKTGPANQDDNAKTKEERRNDAAEKARKALEKRIKELARPENAALKEAALTHFDDWRDKVMQRIGEAVNQRDDGEKAGRQDHQSRPSSQQKPDPAGESLQGIFPPLETPLISLSDARRVLVMHSILLILLGLESYPAESRVLMLRLASSLGLSMDLLAQDEISVAKGLLEAAKQQMDADEETKKKVEEGSTARRWKVGLGAVAGAVLIGVTGGLAAPLLAAGVGTVMGGLGLGATATAGYLGALAGSAPLVGILFGAYGGRMTGKMVDEYAKEVEDFAFIPINKPSLFQRGKQDEKNTRHLRVTVGIAGWLVEEKDVALPWQAISGRSTEAFALRWELDALLRLGCALNTYIKSYAWGFAKKEILSRTIFATLASALTLPYALAKASRVIDNPFSVAVSRSEKAGKVLADALINKVQGERPVTLIGYSLGARVIYTCLAELADRKAFGLVESVCLIGSAAPSDPIAWRKIRSVVAGRVINVFSTKDYLLAFLYRANSFQYGIAGLQAIREVQGIENADVSSLVDGHTQYRFLVGSILQKLGLEDIDGEVVENQMKKLKRQEKEDKEERERKEAEGKSAEEEADEMEKEVEQKSKAAKAMDWVGNKVSGINKKKSTPTENVMTEEDMMREAEKR